MIAKDTFTTYAQYNEDVILAALLSNIETGFYVDVGANHEQYHSVTKYFYDKGWSGINIEPIPRLINEFKKKRKRDINLQLAVSTRSGQLELRDYPKHDGLSTLSAESKNELAKRDLPHLDYKVQVDSLEGIFKKHKVNHIDFLKIDVEGYESEVLRSNNWDTYRPTVICIEANHKTSDWSEYIESQDYRRVIFDGLNEYYLAKESEHLLERFAERATLLHHNGVLRHHIDQWKADLKRIKFLEDFTDRQDAQIKSMDIALKQAQYDLRQYSFKNRSYLGRLRVAVKALSIGYYRDKKSRTE